MLLVEANKITEHHKFLIILKNFHKRSEHLHKIYPLFLQLRPLSWVVPINSTSSSLGSLNRRRGRKLPSPHSCHALLIPQVLLLAMAIGLIIIIIII